MGNKCPLSPQPVLVLLHGDGFVEVYGERNLRVKIMRVPFTASKAGERLADQVVDQLLPAELRELHFPGKLRAASDNRPLLASELVDGQQYLQLLQGLDSVMPEARPNRVWRL